MAASLAERLRADTRSLHTEVERTPFMHTLLRGQMALLPYCLLLRNLHAIYVALEAALTRHAHHALVSPVFEPGLFRSHALAQDLDALHGGAWQHDLALRPAAEHYVDRLSALQETRPELLVAHAYVRYLGDLSGGQLLKRIISKSPLLRSGASTAFYDFGDVQRTGDLTQAFRAGLGAMDASDANIAAIVAEALLAFRLHDDLFQQLAQVCGISEPADVKAP